MFSKFTRDDLLFYYGLEKWFAKNCFIIILMVEFGWNFTLLGPLTMLFIEEGKKKKEKKKKKKRRKKEEERSEEKIEKEKN